MTRGRVLVDFVFDEMMLTLTYWLMILTDLAMLETVKTAFKNKDKMLFKTQ